MNISPPREERERWEDTRMRQGKAPNGNTGRNVYCLSNCLLFILYCLYFCLCFILFIYIFRILFNAVTSLNSLSFPLGRRGGTWYKRLSSKAAGNGVDEATQVGYTARGTSPSVTQENILFSLTNRDGPCGRKRVSRVERAER